MSCADVQTIQSGNGTKTQFSFDFPYIFKSEIHVYFWNATTKEWDEKLTTDATYPWQIDDANPTIVEFTGTAPPNKTDQVLGENEDYVDNVKIRRVTNTDDIRALFNPGSAIRSDDLNKNFEQLRYALQEANCPGVPEDVEEYLKDYYWDRFDNTIYDGNPWVSDDTKIATTEAIDDRVDTKIDTAITTDITGADGIDVRPNTSNGTTVIGIQEGGVDANRLLEDDIIIETEGLTETQSGAFNDDRLVSAATAEHRYRNYVTQPGASALSTTNKLKGQVWFQNDADKTVSIFNGTSWVAVASGGDFTVQPTTIYVDRYSGNDTNNGRRIINQVRTIKRALELANDGDYISIAPGVYQEQLPLDITQKNLSIVGDSIRSVFVQPLSNCESKMQDPYQTMEAEQTVGAGTTNPDYWNVNQQNYVDAVMFRCNSGTYIANMTFVGMKADTTGADPHPIDAYNSSTNPTGLPSYQGWIFGFLPGAKINKSPYIQNCTNFTDSQILNSNYREDYSNPMPGDWDQRVAYSTTDIAAGTAGDLTSEFTGGGIIIDGAKPAYDSKLRSMVADSFTQVGLKGPGIFVTNNGYTQLTSSYSFFGHYHLKAHNGGQANLAASTTDFGDYALVADGKSPSAIFTAQVNQTSGYPVGSDKIKIDDISSFTIGGGGTGVPSTNMVVQIGSVVYPITNWNSTTGEITIFRANQTNASLNDGLQFFVSNNTTVSFYFRSMVASSGHTMEYAGSGTDYRALPENGGTPDETKQITELDGGKIWAVIVDHQGKFKAGDFEVDQQTGSVSLPQGSLGIPLLIQTLDTANETVKSTAQNGIQIGSNVDLNNYKIVGLGTPGQNTDAANKQYTDGKVGEVDVTLPITKTTATANGVKTVTLDINAATTSAAGIVQLNTATDSTSTTTAATASAVKAAYDHADTANTTADAALPKTGGAMSGNIDLNQNIGITFDNGSGPGTAGSITGITDTTNTNSSTVVASAAAVKEAYDLAAGALPTDGTGQMTGDLNLNSNDITNGGAIAAASVTTTGNIVIGGNLQVDGTTTTVNSTEITLDDKNLTLSSIVGEDFVGNTTNNSPTITGVSDDDFAKVIDNMLVTGTGVPANTYIVSHQTVNNVNEVTVSNNITATNSNITFSQPGPSDLYSNGGGVTVKGTTDKTFNYVESSTSWTSSENINLASGKDYKINGSSVLNATTLGSTVTGSSLTSVGTIGTGTWNGTTIGVDYGGTGQTSYTDGELLIGNSTGNTLSKATITGGDGITVTNGTGSISLAADLKANGGLVTEGQDNEIAVDLGASSITGTLAAADGGTGQTSYADGELLIGNSSGTTLSKATLTAGTNVNITNGNGSITIAATDTNTTYTAGDGLDLTNTEFSVDLAANGGLEISNTELQVDSSVARSTGDTFTGNLFLSETSGNVLNTLAFKELAANGSHFVGFKAPSAIAADVTWTLPAADGATTQILSTDGAGILYWQTPTPETLKGGGTNRVFFENDQAVTANYSITLGKNAMSAGPLAVNPSVTITIPPGSTWTIV